MAFDEVLGQVIELLRREGRLSYRALKRRFSLDDEYLEDIKSEIIEATRCIRKSARVPGSVSSRRSSSKPMRPRLAPPLAST
jgi:hypothetical protein